MHHTRFLLCSQRDVQQLKSILCTPSLNTDLQRAAAEQLLSLAAEQRFATALSEPALLHAIHGILTSTARAGDSNQDADDSHVTADVHQHETLPDMQLCIACLQLLVGIVQHCSEAQSLLLQDADRCEAADNMFTFKWCTKLPHRQYKS